MVMVRWDDNEVTLVTLHTLQQTRSWLELFDDFSERYALCKWFVKAFPNHTLRDLEPLYAWFHDYFHDLSPARLKHFISDFVAITGLYVGDCFSTHAIDFYLRQFLALEKDMKMDAISLDDMLAFLDSPENDMIIAHHDDDENENDDENHDDRHAEALEHARRTVRRERQADLAKNIASDSVHPGDKSLTLPQFLAVVFAGGDVPFARQHSRSV